MHIFGQTIVATFDILGNYFVFLRCPSFLANLLSNFFPPNFKIPRQIITGDQAGCHISLLLRCERDSLPITGPTHTLEQAKRKWKEVTILVHQPQYFDHSFRVGLAVVVPELSQIRQSLSFPPHNRYQTLHISLLRRYK